MFNYILLFILNNQKAVHYTHHNSSYGTSLHLGSRRKIVSFVPVSKLYNMLHPLPTSTALPSKFTNPFGYLPHPLCVQAAAEVQHYLSLQTAWHDELQAGKMFGVLVVQTPSGEPGFLAAFSGVLAGSNRHDYFVPPVYDLLKPDGTFRREEAVITRINHRISELERSPRLIRLKAELQAALEQAHTELTAYKADLKEAKAARDQRRQSGTPTPEEEAAMIRESQHQKASLKRLERLHKQQTDALHTAIAQLEAPIETLKRERKERSAQLQQFMFGQFRMLNARGEEKDLTHLFADTVHRTPPAGAGECAAPKLLQCAYRQGLKPIAMAEFWWGNSPVNEVRHHGYYYPACKGKCEPILGHMLQGLEVDDLLLSPPTTDLHEPQVFYEDDTLLVAGKPAGMLSVPGKGERQSLYQYLKEHRPEVKELMMVHRLDMDTSGLIVVAKNKQAHRHLQQQFREHTVVKRYIALLQGTVTQSVGQTVPQSAGETMPQSAGKTMPQSAGQTMQDTGIISLPLCPDLLDRPRQQVNHQLGKPAVTRYEVLERTPNYIRIAFCPITGRTHQLRVHASHPEGLNAPIIGDPLYGQPADRLYLHAEYLEFTHPVSGERVKIEWEAEW
jgi:tRNA pseudouridine32 synthase/23S rRNA pseudouridine746 synthase